MGLHKAGFKNSVGLCGVALGKEHLALLNRFENITINLLLNNDKAGKEATKRNITILLENQFYNSFVVLIQSKFKDCNEILMHEQDKFQSMQKMPIVEYMLQEIFNRFSDTSLRIETRNSIINEVKGFLDSIKAEYIRLEYYKFARNLFGFEISSVKEKVQHKNNKNKQVARKYFNVFQHNYIALRILKSAYNNKIMKGCLLEYGHEAYFNNLGEEFNYVINEQINNNLAQIIFNDSILEYSNYKSFSFDLYDYIQRQKNALTQNILKNPLSLENKLHELKQFNIIH